MLDHALQSLINDLNNQRMHRDLQDGVQPARIRKRACANRIANLGSVMPHFGELAPDVEPQERMRVTRPRDREQCSRVKVQRFDEIGEIEAGPGVEVRQDARAQSFGSASPRRVELVDVGHELPVGGDWTRGWRR